MNDPSVITDSIWVPGEMHSRRSLLLCAVGAVLGLVIAGFGLFTAKGTRTSVVPAEDVALVNQVPILMSDYVQQLRALYDVSLSGATPEQKRKVLDAMIQEELYVQRGVELGLQSDTIEVRTALVGAVEAQVAADATMAQPAESDLKAYYERHADAYSSEGILNVDDFLIPPGFRMPPTAAVAALRSGSSAAQLGLVKTDRMKNGDEFYFAAKIHLGEPLFRVAVRLQSGAVSDPTVTTDGTHILVSNKNVVPVPRAYADVRSNVLRDYTRDQAKILTAGNDRFLRKRADILIAHGFE